MNIRDAMLGSSLIFGMFIVFMLLIVVSVSAAFIYSGINKKDNLAAVYTHAQCQAAGGQVRNTLLTNGACPQGEESIGIVEGINCPCDCCRPK